MQIKKGFIKKNWLMIVSIIMINVLVIKSRDFIMIIAGIIFIASLILKYKNYDVAEQEADDWWNKLTKDDKLKIKGKEAPQ